MQQSPFGDERLECVRRSKGRRICHSALPHPGALRPPCGLSILNPTMWLICSHESDQCWSSWLSMRLHQLAAAERIDLEPPASCRPAAACLLASARSWMPRVQATFAVSPAASLRPLVAAGVSLCLPQCRTPRGATQVSGRGCLRAWYATCLQFTGIWSSRVDGKAKRCTLRQHTSEMSDLVPRPAAKAGLPGAGTRASREGRCGRRQPAWRCCWRRWRFQLPLPPLHARPGLMLG